jgi:hypothetical protein
MDGFRSDFDSTGDTNNNETAEKTAERVLESERRATPKMASDEAERERSRLPQVKKDRRDEVIARLKAPRRCGNSRPLARLAGNEAELDEQSAARANLPQLDKARPDPDLLVYQLTASVNTPFVKGGHIAKKMKGDALRLYAALESKDPIESILDRLIIGLTNATMGCLARTSLTDKSEARHLNLRYAIKGADSLGNLVKLRDARRGEGPQSVTVGKLKIESGGQAIVGNVRAGKRRTKDESDD